MLIILVLGASMLIFPHSTQSVVENDDIINFAGIIVWGTSVPSIIVVH